MNADKWDKWEKYGKEKKEKTKYQSLSQLQSKPLKCVFCGKSSKKVDGGYFKNRFVCKSCQGAFRDTYDLLEGRK